MKPYYEDELVTLYHGDCRELLASLPDDEFDCVLTDPPYGVKKADWDDEFATFWFEDAQRVAPVLGLMPGIWNLGRCPDEIGRWQYKWTLAAHLSNGTGRGALGLADWIPCLVYVADEEPRWCRQFAAWCEAAGVTKKRLDAIAGTSDMGGWWLSKLAHRSTVPAPHQWEKLKAELDPPRQFDALVYAGDPYADAGSTSKVFSLGAEPKANHPSPKPLSVTRWFLQRLPGYRLGRGVLDVFAGSGTTLRAAKDLGMPAVGIELDEAHCETAAARLSVDHLPFGHSAPDPVDALGLFDLGDVS